MKFIFSYKLFLIIISFSITSVHADELTCYSSVYAPYSFVDKGKPTGIDIDLISEIAKKIDINISFKIIPWSRLNQLVLAGEINCAAAFLKSSEYTKNMFYMKNPITIGDYTLFTEKNEQNQLENLSDFYGSTIAVNRGFNIPLALQQAISEGLIKKYEVGKVEQSLQMLSSSRVTGVLADKHVGLFNINKLKITNVTSISKPLVTTPVYLVFSKKLKESGIVDKFEIALEQMKLDGTYQKILDNYLL